MIDPASVPTTPVRWPGARRMIRSIFPPIDLFEDIADPADWPLLIAAEQKTNPRVMETIGTLDLVPPKRRRSGPDSTYLMAPFTHVSPDRPSRFSAGALGVLYAGRTLEAALLETIHHHAIFMRRTKEAPGWTSQFREIVLDIDASLHDLRGNDPRHVTALDPVDYEAGQALGAALRQQGSDGLVYPSRRSPGGECVGLFYPDGAANPIQGRHSDYHWNGDRVDFCRDAGNNAVFRVTDPSNP